MIDIWKYDLKNEYWSPYLIQSKQPDARSEFGYVKNGDMFIMYGGQGDEGLLDDMYLLDLKNELWEEVTVRSKVKPVARKGTCMAVTGYTIIIFGGKTLAGYTNEIWTFDFGTGEYTMLDTEGDIPPPLAYSKCSIRTGEEGEEFLVFFGESTGVKAQSGVYSLNLTEKKWTKVRGRFYDPISRSEASAVLLDNRVLLAGGHEAGTTAHSEIYDLDLVTDQYTLIGNLPKNSFSASMVYYEDKLFIHGGGYSFSTLSIRNIPTNDFYVIQLNEQCDLTKEFCNWPCSKGSFLNSTLDCEACSPGHFSDELGALECKACSAGYYLPDSSADSSIQCKPCDRGKYNSYKGQHTCRECPYNTKCPISSTYPVSETFSEPSFTSSHPILYDESTSSLTRLQENIWLSLSLLYLFLLILLVSKSKLRRYLQMLDIYKEHHNYKIGSIMYLRKTLAGGVFTFIAMSMISILVLHSSVNYLYDNIKESKALVPNVALETDYEKFEAETIVFEFTFMNYGGDCGHNHEFTHQMTLITDNVIGTLNEPTCEKIGNDCYIKIVCMNCEIIKAGSIEVVLNENQSFATDIRVKVTSSSSIPSQTSGISTSILNQQNTIFRGFDASVIHLLVTPSLFLSEVDEWEDEKTGYHISELKDPSPGSLIEISQ